MTRRELLKAGVQSTAGVVLAPVAGGWGELQGQDGSDAGAAKATLALRRAREAPVPLAAEFTGLGYEMSSIATAGLLSAGNGRYVRLVRQLGGRGVIRAGGIVADYTRYEADGAAAAEPKRTVVTRESLRQFAGFLEAVSWSAIWSLNFAQGTLEEAVVEAQAVAGVLGTHLLAFELGNEVENYGGGSRPFRRSPYTYEEWHAEWSRWRGAIVQAVPGARFAAPDTAASLEWVERAAADAHGDVQLLTTHYYRNEQHHGSAEQLTGPDPVLLAKLERLRAAAVRSGIPWRMCEANSFSGGGLPGVSDTLLGALWTLDWMLLCAQFGAAGVNLETGVNQLGFVSSYSPIQDDGRGVNTAGAPYYGMLAFAQARLGCDAVFALEPAGAPGVTAYGLGMRGVVRAGVVINRTGSSVRVEAAMDGQRLARVMRLSGPSLGSGAVRFAGAAVDEEGRWAAREVERVDGAGIAVAAGSAVVLRGVRGGSF